MESNEVIKDTEIEVIDENNEVFEVADNSREFSDTMKKLGIAFCSGMVGAAGAAVINIFVVPKVAGAISAKKAKKNAKKNESKPEEEHKEKKNVNPYSSTMKMSFK